MPRGTEVLTSGHPVRIEIHSCDKSVANKKRFRNSALSDGHGAQTIPSTIQALYSLNEGL